MEIFSFSNLYKAHKKSRCGKRKKKEVIKFELNLGQNLVELKHDMLKNTYKIKSYKKFTVFDPKKREIQALGYKHRVVQHVLCDNYLVEFIDKKLIYDNVACRKNKGTHFGIARLQKFLRSYYAKYGTQGYVLKFDIRKYFVSINHNILKQKLEKDNIDPEIFKYIEIIINSFEHTSGIGLPIGNQTSQLFAIYYLNELDRYIKEIAQVKYYVRYMDDGVIIHESKQFLKNLLQELKKIVLNLKLEFNEKTMIFPLKNGIDFLGFRFYLTNTGKVVKRLRTSRKKKFKRRIRGYVKNYKLGNLQYADIKRSLASFEGHIMHGNTYRFYKNALKHLKLQAGLYVSNSDVYLGEDTKLTGKSFIILK